MNNIIGGPAGGLHCLWLGLREAWTSGLYVADNAADEAHAPAPHTLHASVHDSASAAIVIGNHLIHPFTTLNIPTEDD